MADYIKFEQDNNDNFMDTYLNADYLTSDLPLSPPNSSSSSAGSYSPEKQVASDFLLDMNVDDLLLNNEWMVNPYLLLEQPNEQDALNSLFLSSPPTEAPKKKRGRKKREVQQVQQISSSLLAPKPVINTEPIIKFEPPTSAENNKLLSNEQEAQKAAQLAKRQERLIKNRAAALLSRKRKREHLNSLEEENQKLHGQVDELEKRIQTLEKENSELKEKLNIKPTTIATKKTTGVVFMILFFSFALFTLPSRMMFNNQQLTVGGSSVISRQQYPLIDDGSSISSHSMTPSLLCKGDCKDQSTDLVLIDSVRPRDLQMWINHKLEKKQSDKQSHVYLYSKEFSQMASLTKTNEYKGNKPMLSLISPYNQTADISDRYLQIDVQVLGSKVIEGQLTSLQQYDYPSALLDGIKKDLITYPRIIKKKPTISIPIENSRVIS
ncbi:hypothetical protein G6F43_009446 [Rhizopus delemar]|nr:hypothetical protein G6F43_009446 [Rhizopus delemar]